LGRNFHKSIKIQVGTALMLLILLFSGMIAHTLYRLDLRKHDYTILNLSGQLRVLGETMLNQSEHYLQNAPRGIPVSTRDLNLYHRDLQNLIAQYEVIISSLNERIIPPELTGDSEPLYCTWNKRANDQMDDTARIWQDFRGGLSQRLGTQPDSPRLLATANYVVQQQADLRSASADLAAAFRSMMEEKLQEIVWINRATIALGIILGIGILLVLFFKVFRPLSFTVRGFERVSRGDLAYQIDVRDDNEVGRMTSAFNELAQRLAALFRLTDNINQAINLDDTVKFVFQEFRSFLPINWVCLLRTAPDGRRFVIDRIYTDRKTALHERDWFDVAGSIFTRAMTQRQPLNLARLYHDDSNYSDDDFVTALKRDDLNEVILLPLTSNSSERAALVLATSEAGAYRPEHLELLTNISGQLSHSFDKTLGMEGLVISAVEGLAKLAESRDPETGDHLVRMSLYSAAIAEQLGEDGRDCDAITPAYVRDIYRFAPMHDIGKVGIEDSILLKPGKLTELERSRMQQHPVIGGQVLRRCEKQVNKVGHSIFRIGIEIAEAHHEKYDGSGYPGGLQGETIPLSARIVAAADVFDALTSKRPYKEAWDMDRAMGHLKEQAGQHFDPEIITAMERCMPKLVKIYDEHKHV